MAKQAGEAPSAWTWVEPSVWTERMLTALDMGVKGGQWFSLIDKVYCAANLRSAAAKVAANGGSAGVDRVTTEQFSERLDENVEQLTRQLRERTFRPQAIRRA
jgi:RNA-directed DNA polymerase